MSNIFFDDKIEDTDDISKDLEELIKVDRGLKNKFEQAREKIPRWFNPFQPNRPCSIDIFTGREKEIRSIVNALEKTDNSESEHVLIIGDRGIGKSSLAMFVENAATFVTNFELVKNKNINYFTVFNSLGTVKNLEELCIKLLENCYRELKKSQNRIYAQLIKTIKKIKGFTVGGYGLQFDFNENPKIVSAIFDTLMMDFWDKVNKKYSSMLIIIDETDHISNDKDFSSFFKSLIETFDRNNCNNIMFLFTATPQGLSNLIIGHDAFPRLFKKFNIKNLSRKESDELIIKTLQKSIPKAEATNRFLELVYEYSDGLPCFIHEICYESFEVNNDRMLGVDDFRGGVIGNGIIQGAIKNIYDIHFRQRYTQEILSNTYREILHIISSFKETYVKSAEILKKFKGNKKTCNGCLNRMVGRGFLKKAEGKKGYYRIPEKMFKLWLRSSSINSK